MIRLTRNYLSKITIGLVFFSLVTFLRGQTPEFPNNLDLGIRFDTNVTDTVKINGVFGVSAQVYLEANSSTIPDGEWVEAKIELTDPDGIILDSYVQVWNGFNSATDGWLEENPATTPNQVLFQLPWAQAEKWGPDKKWTISIHVDAPAVETSMSNNFASRQFSVVVPNLALSVNGVAAINPINGEPTTTYIPGTNYLVTGSVANVGEVMTQAGVYAPVVAQLRKRSGDFFGEILDEQIILLPDSSEHTYLAPDQSVNFTIENLMMPADASGEYAVTLNVNPRNIIGGAVMVEQSFANNEGNFTFTIQADADQSNEDGVARIEFVENSFSGESGDFRGLDPIFLSFAVRNRGDAPVAASDLIYARLILSKDLLSDENDFVLREFNLGGGGIGQGLLSGETVNLTWFQQLPDNLEGDFYLLIDITHGSNDPVTTPIDTTPTFTLLSQDHGTTNLIFRQPSDQIQERPSISDDGRFIVFESPDDSGIQQIYLIDRMQALDQKKLISKSYLSTEGAAGEISGNDDSFRPQISADGRKIVFYSRATNLVIGDTNLKEDVFLYDTTLNTMLRPTNSLGEQLDGSSFYPAMNGDGSRIVFESDSTNVATNVSGNQIYFWKIESNGTVGLSTSLWPLTSGDLGSYSPSIDDEGRLVVFDSFATNLLPVSPLVVDRPISDDNDLRDIFLINTETNETYLASYNYFGKQTENDYTGDRPDPGHSRNAKISGDGTTIVFESTADNLQQGGGIASVIVTKGGVGYQGNPTIEIVDTNVSNVGALGSGAVLALREDGINVLREIKTNAIMIVDPGINYVAPRITIHPDPDFPAPTIPAQAVAYLNNPEGDVYMIKAGDVMETPSFSLEGAMRISQNQNGVGGNFGSRNLSISTAGDKIVYSTKSSNLLRELTLREDGKKFYNSPYILPKAEAILVGGIGEIEIFDNGRGYSPGNLKITDLSGTGSGAIASYQVDNRGRIVTIDIVEPGDNYNLATTYVAVEEPRGGEGFIAGEIRFIPTIGEGVTRRGGAKIHKVEMKEYGYGYKIGETSNDRFGEIFDFEGDGADLNEDGFPDGKINPDMVRLLEGSLYLQQSFTVEVITRVPELLSATVLEIYDWENPLDPVRITFNSSSNQTNGTEVGVNGLTQNEIRDSIITAIGNSLDLNASRTEVSEGPVYESSTSDASFSFSALSGRFITNNPQAVKVIEHSNMLINGSGYSRSTPIINQVPSIYGFSEIDGYPEIEVKGGVGRSTLLSQPDIYSDDIYLYDVVTSENHRISTSTFGTPAGYLANPIPAPPSSRFPQISGNGRYIAFSSDVYGVGGLAFGGSNQVPLINSQNPVRNIYLKDLKSFVVTPPNSGYTIDLLLPNKSKVFEFAPQTPIPIFANFDYNGDFNMSVYLNRKRLTNDQITLDRYSGAHGGGFSSSRFTGKLDPLKIRDLNTSGEFSLELVAFGEGNVTIAVSDTVLFKVTPFGGSLPPRVKISQPREVFTSQSSFPISAFADDPDGAVNAVTFFVNGVPVMDESNYSSILRTPGIVEENVIYSTNIKISELIDLDTYALDRDSGILSIVAIAYDNSGNAVSSEMINLSYTKGNENTPKIDLSFGGDYKDLSRAYKDINYMQLVQGKDFNLTIGSGNKITSVDLNISALLNADLITTKRFYQLDIFSRNGGEGAKLDLNHTNSTVEVLLGGTGYTNDRNTTITITPILRSYNHGEEAILTPNNLGSAIVIKQNPAGVEYIGSGYSIFPRARPLPANSFPDSDSLPIALESPELPSSSIDNGFVISSTDMVSTSYDVFGGFTQSPILLSVDVNQTHEAIESVSLLIDGTFSEDLTKYEPSYVDSGNSTIQRFDFSWIPEISKYYSISAIVTDMGGNVISTHIQNVFIEDFYAGGISLEPIGEPDILVESTESIFLSADVVSQFDIEQVEFFIDDQWVGKGENRGGTNFQTSIDLEPYNFRPGRYEISYRAIDEKGNMAGTFSRFLTNLTSRQNHILTIVPPASLADTNVSMVSPVTEISVPKNSTLRLTALAQDTSGNLKGLRFFSPQSVEKGPLYSWRQIIDLNATGIFNDTNLSSIDNLLDGTFLKIDDGTGKDSITLEFDADQTVQAQTNLPIVVGGAHNLKNDFSISAGSTYTHYHSLAFLFEIDGVTGATDTFKWSKDGGITFVGEKIPITPGAIPLNRSFGIDVEFSSITGHGLGDSWSFIAYPKNHIVQIDSSVDPAVKLIRTRNFLTAAINEAQELGLTSIRSSTTDDANLLFLNHLNDEHYKDVNVSGNSLINETTGDGLLQIIYDLSDYRHVEGVSENYDGTLIMPRVADSRMPQPFGLTWEANETGQFYFYALSEDFADSQSVSQSIKVTVTEPVGKVPVIELSEISDTISYMGSALSMPLLAEASDPDGEVAFVEFYVNGELIQEDNARPFEASLEINATGYLEVHATARDNVGNITTSNVQGVIVNSGGVDETVPLEVSFPGLVHQGGQLEIYSNYKSPSKNYSNIEAYVYLNDKYLGEAEILPYTPPGPDGVDAGQNIYFEFSARALGEQELTVVVINGSETESVSSPLTVTPSPVTDDEEFIKLLFTGLYSRSPEPYELSENLQLLQDRIYTREQIIERLRTDFEFTKARNIILAHKTLKGEWKKIEDALLEAKDPDETPAIGAGAEGGVRPDDPGDAGSGTLVPLNTPITASIENADDIDYFRVQTLGAGKNTTLTISVSAGHPGVYIIQKDPYFVGGDRLNIVGPGVFPVPSVSGWGTNQAAGPGTSSTISVTYNLANFEGDNNWYIEVPVFGNAIEAGPGKDYTIQFTMEIPVEDDDGGIAEPSSEVIDFKIRNHLWYWLDNLQYLNLYGEINTHDPESFFVRLFKNRYEQLPNPSQIARGVQLLNDDDGNYSQFQFLQDFAIENKVITAGSYNYTNTDGNGSSLSIPNVPLDAAALAETALVYTALVGEVPENGEVARLTLTPEYELRPMTERARMIMELPSFAARFGMAMPEVDLPNLRNGRKYNHGKEVLIDASSLGPDNLGGTKDDGSISNLKILLNKSENQKWIWTPDSTSLDSNISADGFYYNFTIPSDIPSGTYTFEVIAEDKNGLISRAERKIHLGTIDQEVLLLTPETDEVLDIDEIKTFKFDLGSDHNSSAYLEINGHIPWIGSLQFSADDLPQDESTISISDGSGRTVTFEFDSDYNATATEIATVEKMYVVGGGSLSLTTDSNYLGTDSREYIVEIDGNGTGANGHDTFRWSIDGGANFNDYGIEIDTDLNNSLGSGIEISFDSNTSYQLGDRWRIKAYPINEIVEVGRYGSFADRLATTRQNFIDAVNIANNMGKLAMRAKASVVESTSSGWFNSLDENRYGVELRRLGSTPVREKIAIDNLTAINTTLSTSDWLEMPWLEEGNGTQTMSLDLRKLGFTQPLLEARVVAFDELNNTVNSEPRIFTLRDPSRLSIEFGDPVGRKASVRIVGDVTTGLKANNFQVLDGGAGYTGDTPQLSIISEFGRGASLRPVINQLGEVASVEVVSPGSGYTLSDLILVSSPLQYKIGDSVSVGAKVRDPLSELDRVAFYVNGVELDANSTSGSGSTYSASYEFSDESAKFVTARALYGDDRDRGPSTIAEGEWMHGPGISGDRINYWGWRRHWAEQHFHGPGYVFPEWFIQDQDYWALPPPWLSLPYGPGAVPVEVHTEPEKESISITGGGNVDIGQVGLLGVTYRSVDGDYDDDLKVSVYVDDQFAGYATRLEYEEPEFWEEDPGYKFEFVLPVHTSGTKEMEFYILDGDRTYSAYASVNGEESPLTDHYKFLKQLWNGIYDRDPLSAEINAYLFALDNGSMNRAQVIENLRTAEEFAMARDLLLTSKTLHGVWKTLPTVLEATDQEGYGSMSGGGAANSAAAQAAMGMPYTPADGNESDLGFYEGVEDDHANFASAGTWISMNEIEVPVLFSYSSDLDYFRIKSENLSQEGILRLALNRTPFGETIPPSLGGWKASLGIAFLDGSTTQIRPTERSSFQDVLTFSTYNLNGYTNVDYYFFTAPLFLEGKTRYGVTFLSTSNSAYLDQANFLTEEEIAQLQIESRVNDFNPNQAITYQTNSFSYTNRYGQIETHDPANFFHRLFLNKYDQEPNPMQANRGVQLLNDGTRSQVDFLQQFATENNIITVGGYNYTTSANELAIPNVPIDAAAFAETALVYSALMGKAPSNVEVAKLTLDPYFEVRPLAERARLILEMPEYAAQYSVSVPKVDFLNVQNGMVLDLNDSIHVEAFDHGIDGTSGSFDDGEIATVSLLLNGLPLEEKEGNRTSSEYTFDFNKSVTGEYDLEVVAHNVQGEMGRAHRRVFAGTRAQTISIDTPNNGAVLSKAAPAEFTFSTENVDLSNGTGYLEINGKVRWSGAISITDDLMLDQSTLTFHDGTNRGAVAFEMDVNESASSYEIHATTVRKSGEGNVTASGTYTGPAEGIEYWVIIDSNSSTFKWMEVGAMEPNATAVSINTDDNNYSLDYGVQIHFDSNDSYAFGDAWKIVVQPETDLVEVETEGSFENRLARSKRNLISSINRANSEGLLALRAEDPMANNRIAGMLPVTMPVNRAVVLRHDGSYPIIADLNVSTSAGGSSIDDLQQGMFSFVEATGTYDADVSYETNKTRWELTLSEWDALELCDGLLEVRLVHLSNDGNITYSNKRAYPVVDPSLGYVELIGPMGTVYEPGRLPTVHFSENFTTGILPWKDDTDTSTIDEITIMDGGTGYRWYDEDSKQFTIVSSSGFGGNLQIKEINPSTEEVTAVYAESNSTKGAGYHHSDVIVPSPPAFFDKYQTIDLSARLRDPYNEYQRLAFYFNGVETNATVEDRSGGVFGTAFMPTLPGDKFVTARALYGDSRDYGPRAPHTFGQYPCNDGYYGGKDHWGWKKSWLQQHYSTGQEFLPSWYNQLENYWVHENNEWARAPMWDGAAPVRIGEKDVYESVVIQISPSSPALQGSYGSELLHSQMTTVDAISEWSERVAPSFSSAQLYGNNILLDEIEVDTNNTAINRITFNFEWFVNYKSFKEQGGKVELRVLGITSDGRQILSPTKTTYIRPLDYTDPVSTAAMILTDLVGEPPSDTVLEEILPKLNTSSLGKLITTVVESSIAGELQHMADIVSVYHVLYGEYPKPNAFNTIFAANKEALLANRAQTLQAYIQSELTSIKYTSRYGIIPNDTAHFFGRLEGINLSKRTDFVKRHYKNKYGVEPTFLQSMQGAKKMWDYAGGVAATNDYLMNRLAAADFIFNMATEPIERIGFLSTNFSYLNGMSSLRGVYLDKAKQYPISQATNMQELSRSAEEMVTSDESSGRLVKVIVDDPAFKRRFNLMWEDSAKMDGLEFWKHEDWFGHFMDEKYPWIYHVDLGWLYSHGTSQKNVWLYSKSIGWFWTNREVFKNDPNLTTDNQRFIFRVRPQSTGGWEGSWSLVTLPGQGNGSNAIQVYDYGYNPF